MVGLLLLLLLPLLLLLALLLLLLLFPVVGPGDIDCCCCSGKSICWILRRLASCSARLANCSGVKFSLGTFVCVMSGAWVGLGPDPAGTPPPPAAPPGCCDPGYPPEAVIPPLGVDCLGG